MKLLSIEAAATPATVALAVEGTIEQRQSSDPRAQAEHLLELVQALLDARGLKLNQLDGVAVGRGPGSFTGLRVAAALAQGLAYSSQLAVASVSTLAAIAHQSFAECDALSGPLLVCLDARKEQVYCALYERDELGRPQQVSPEAVCDPADVAAQLGPRAVAGAGNGFSEYAALAELALPWIEQAPSAQAIAVRALSGEVEFDAPYLALPEYVRNNVTHGS